MTINQLKMFELKKINWDDSIEWIKLNGNDKSMS